MSNSKKKTNRRTFQKNCDRKESHSPSKNIISLTEKLKKIYESSDLRTTCPGHCVCCHVACPQMHKSEFLAIVDRLYGKDSVSERCAVLKASIRYFFSNALVKPCPLLVGNRCSVYDIRPLSCRIYGLWPEDMYEKRVENLMKSSGLKKEEIPLNTQCKFVRRVDKSAPPLTEEEIEGMYAALDVLDMNVGGFNKMQIKKRYNQRTWHDWFMVTVFGEDRLSALTTFLLAADEDSVNHFVEEMCERVDNVGDSLFTNYIG